MPESDDTVEPGTTGDTLPSRRSIARGTATEPDAGRDAGADFDTTVVADSERTRIGSRRRPISAAPVGRRPFAVTLPSQAPVTDYRRLDFRPPEVLPGRTVHYPVRSTATTRELPPFEPGYELPERVATLSQRREVGGVVAAELRRSRSWRARAAWTIAGSALAALAVAAVGFYGLAQL